MKKASPIILFLLLICRMDPLSAQEKKFRFELGLNYPIPISLQENASDSSIPGFYLNWTYNLVNSPLSIGMKLSSETYTILFKKDYFFSESFDFTDGGSASLIASINYHFVKNKAVDFYMGDGIGVSADNLSSTGINYHLAVVHQIGILFTKHINLSLQYYITHKDFSRLIFGFGYVF